MLKTAHNAEEFMRTGARVSPSWPGGDLRGRIRCSRLFADLDKIPCRRGGPYVFNAIPDILSVAPAAAFSSIPAHRTHLERVLRVE
jgi:hypothetical protein